MCYRHETCGENIVSSESTSKEFRAHGTISILSCKHIQSCAGVNTQSQWLTVLSATVFFAPRGFWKTTCWKMNRRIKYATSNRSGQCQSETRGSHHHRRLEQHWNKVCGLWLRMQMRPQPSICWKALNLAASSHTNCARESSQTGKLFFSAC